MRLAILTPCLVLAACVSPQQQCISGAGADLRVNAALIAEVEGNLSRGFALREEQRVREFTRTCIGETESGEEVRTRCEQVQVRNVRVPEPIDLNAERAKLVSLQERRAQLQARADSRVAACRAQFPEG